MAQQIALLDDEEREAALEGLDLDDLQYDWKFWRRPSQTFPTREQLNWWIGLMMAGRGAGKTRTGTEWAHEKAISMPGSRGLLVARTAADTRDVLVEGDSGLLQVGRPGERAHYESSKRRVTWPNGSPGHPVHRRGARGAAWSAGPLGAVRRDRHLAADPGRRRADRLGPRPDRHPSALGYGEDRQRPQIMALTTPKRTPIMKKLLELVEENPAVILRRDTTAANAGNLDPEYLNMIYGLFGGTRLSNARSSTAMMLEDVEGALWTQLILDVDRVERLPYVPLVYVIAVDPSVAEEPTDECGILVCASTTEQDLYRASSTSSRTPPCSAPRTSGPPRWCSRPASTAARWWPRSTRAARWSATRCVNIDPTIKVLDVRARYGKQTRAEPVSLAFEQHRGHLLGWWPDLESQLTSWTPMDRKSPDRLDAMVWGATALLIKPPPRALPQLDPCALRRPAADPAASPPSPIPPARGDPRPERDRFARPSPGWRMVHPRSADLPRFSPFGCGPVTIPTCRVVAPQGED